MSNWLWQVISLVIVLFESAFLYYWFFLETFKYRYDSKKKYLVMMIFPISTYFSDILIDVPSVKMFILLLIGIILIYFVFQCTMVQALVWNVLFMFLLIVSESISMGFLLSVHGNDDISVFQEHSFFRVQCLILSKLINVVLIVLCVKLLSKGKKKKYTLKEAGLLLLQAFSSILCLVMIVEFSYSQVNYSWSMSFLFLLGITVLLSYIVFYYLINGYFTYRDREEEVLLIETKNNRILNNFKNLEKTQQRVYELYHDLKKHLNVINMMENKKEVNVYLENCLDGIQSIEGKFQTGNQYIDMILYDEWKKAYELGIKVQIAVERGSLNSIELHDVVIILGNALENAREACKKRIETGKNAYMQLKIVCLGGEVIFVVSNNYIGKIVRKENDFLTTKRKKDLHGIGMKSIRSSVEKYDGNMNISTKEDKFILTVILKSPED